MKRERFLFVFGFVAVLFLTVPFLLLGEHAVFTYHDQLDGEMIAYILQAKHLWDGSFLPEFLAGTDKTALTLPAPGCVLLFQIFHPLTALIIMQLMGNLAGFAGMYLLSKKVTESDIAGLITGIFYAAIPFLPVYGLSQFGLPMLLWCILRVRETDQRKTRIGVIVYAVFYALNSSLVLVGFAVLAVLGVWVLWELARGKKRKEYRVGFRMALLWICVTLTYVLTNLRLIGQVLGLGNSIVSHKAEYVLTAEAFWSGWWGALLHGGQHSEDYHIGFLWLVAAVLLFVSFAGVRGPRSVSFRNMERAMWAALGCNICLTGVSALWNSRAGVDLRGALGTLGAFQMDRLLWLCPCLWYLLLGCAVACILRLLREEKRLMKTVGMLGCVLVVISLATTGIQIVKNSDVKANLQKLHNEDYRVISYSDYYALGVLDQVRDFLGEYTGKETADYRVISLGIDPAAALYHGFYCLDGYSNNYSLEYKHQFRRVIAPALSESEYLRAYYDEWGNRCYLFGTESPGYYTIEKGGFYFQHLECDTEALRELGGNYLFSAAFIANSEELGLTLLRGEPFEAEGSYYRIFVYEVQEP